MLKSKKKSGNETIGNGNAANQILAGTKVIGDIISKGNFRLDGELEGNLISESRVVLGANSNLIGSLKSQSAEVSGAIKGVIEVQEELKLTSTAVLNADIVIGSLDIDSGAVLNGTTKMANGNKKNEKA